MSQITPDIYLRSAKTRAEYYEEEEKDEKHKVRHRAGATGNTKKGRS